METWKLCLAIKETLNAKRFAAAVGRTQQTVYAWSRSADDPEQDGSPNLFDWLEAVVDALAARPGGRPVLIQIRRWFIAITDRALGAWNPQPLTRDALAAETATLLREFADLVAECCPDAFDRARFIKEGAEVIAAVDRLMQAAQAGLTEEEIPADVRTARRLTGWTPRAG